jgi:hypothetical protein
VEWMVGTWNGWWGCGTGCRGMEWIVRTWNRWWGVKQMVGGWNGWWEGGTGGGGVGVLIAMPLSLSLSCVGGQSSRAVVVLLLVVWASVRLVVRSLSLLSVPIAWLDDVAHPDGPLMCHVVATVGACGWLSTVDGGGCLLVWVVFVVHR